jgi:hypothetical protein
MRHSRYVGPFEGFGAGPALLPEKTHALISQRMARLRQSLNASVNTSGFPIWRPWGNSIVIRMTVTFDSCHGTATMLSCALGLFAK